MKSLIRDGAIVLTLLTSVGIAAGQTSQMGPNPSSAPTSASTTKPGGTLQLSAAQKTSLYQTVAKEKVKSPPPASFKPSLGASVPPSIELYSLPADFTAQVPAAKQYKYTVAQNQVVLVNPTNMTVVDIIRQ